MRKSKFTDEKIVTILQESDRDTVAASARKYGISQQTIYSWKKRFGTFEVADVKRLRHLEIENGRLKKLVAERDLEIEVMKEINAKKW
jgi:putative transposase